jgi:phosphate transport system substrate-binding protein
VDVIPGMREFIAEYTSDAAMGEDGYLADKGLITLPEDELQKVQSQANQLTPISM